MDSERGLADRTAIVLMAVAAVALATVVAASLAGGIGTDSPRASFVFETDGTDVVVTHYGGDDLDGERIYVESAERGLLGDAAGTDGQACAENRTQLSRGTTCRVADAAYEQLYVVWQADGERQILDRRPADPTPTPTPTVTPTATPSGTVAPNGTVTATAATGTPTPSGTVTAVPVNGTVTATPVDGTATATNGTATPGVTAEGTPAGTDGGAPPETDDGVPPGTDDGTAARTPTAETVTEGEETATAVPEE